MIALLGIESEDPIQLLVEACASKRIPWLLFNQRRQDAWSVDYTIGNVGQSSLANGDVRVRAAECAGIYLRTMDHTRVPEWASSPDPAAVEAMYARLWALLDDDEIPTQVVNAPAIQLSNNSKPYQSIIIQEQGLDIPDTCITSDEDVARAFVEKHAHVIYKSISGVRSIVKCVDDESLTKLARLRYCPVQFQECIEGFNIRVHVVGDCVFATRICSDAIDYRYASQEGKTATLAPYELGPDLAEKCIHLAQALRLPFAGIDLMISGDGRAVCLEVNPSPGYSYYERQTGQRISHALAEYLGCRAGAGG